MTFALNTTSERSDFLEMLFLAQEQEDHETIASMLHIIKMAGVELHQSERESWKTVIDMVKALSWQGCKV